MMCVRLSNHRRQGQREQSITHCDAALFYRYRSLTSVSVCSLCAQSFCVQCLAAQAQAPSEVNGMDADDDKLASLLQDTAALAMWQCLSCQGRCPCALCKTKYRRQRLSERKTSGATVMAGPVHTEMAPAVVAATGTDAPSAITTEAMEEHNDGVDLLVKAVGTLEVSKDVV